VPENHLIGEEIKVRAARRGREKLVEGSAGADCTYF
jgi:hypothetical protein